MNRAIAALSGGAFAALGIMNQGARIPDSLDFCITKTTRCTSGSKEPMAMRKNPVTIIERSANCKISVTGRYIHYGNE